MASISPTHIVIATSLAIAAVVLPLGPVLLALPWLAVICWAYWRESKRQRLASTLLTYLTITTVVFVAAIVAPVKTVDRVLDTKVVLPKTEISLAEMNDDDSDNRWLSRYIRVGATQENAAQVIHFREREITLREFIETVETQSNLKHSVAHCGNGYSILYGGDCCFGLRMSEPRKSQWPPA
ncbi:hypothetical protein [Anatilimnocola floriformis]|uniref:hypothetical protein n=1 Tax=Anatilimnocola floriformis TaxID=2948575 RepID=UPI0020C2F9F7|nr:hypothetical protein [Anatilimnocola floriformis]